MSQFKLKRTALDEILYDTPEGKVDKYNQNTYGSEPGWLTKYNWVKQGYNQSLQGMVGQIRKGQPVFKVDEDYDPNILEDIGSTLISTIMPLDLGTLVLGGGLGGAAVKKLAVDKMVKSGLSKTVAARAVNMSSKKVMNQARSRALRGGTQFGFYSGLSSAANQDITRGDIDFLQTFKDAATGATLGAVTGATASKVSKIATEKKLSPVKAQSLQKGAETFAFGTTQPILEGNMPTLENYAHAAGIIGGLTVAGKLAKKPVTIAADKITQYQQRNALRTSARKEAEAIARRDRGKETWTDGKKEYRIISDYLKYDADKKHIQVENVSNNKRTSINRKEFFNNFTRSRDKFGDNFESKRQKRVFGIAKKDLKLTDKQIKEAVDRVTGEDGPLVKSKKSGRQYRTGYDKLNSEQKNRLMFEMEIRRNTEKTLRNYDKAGIKVTNTSGVSLAKQSLPENIYNIISGKVKRTVKKAGEKFAPLDAVIDNPTGRSLLKLYDKIDVQNATIFSRLNARLEKAKYITPEGKEFTFREITQGFVGAAKKGLITGRKELREQLANDLESGTKDAKLRTQEIRSLMNLTYRSARRAGIDLAPYIENYFPKIIKPKVLKKIYDDLDRFMDDVPISVADDLQMKPRFMRSLERAMGNDFSPETRQALDHIVSKVLRKQGSPMDYAQAFQRLRNEVNSERVQVNKMLEKARKESSLPEEFYERDAGYVLTNYVSQAAKRMSYVMNAGKNGEIVYNKLNALGKTPGAGKQAEMMRKAFDALTGLIETDKNYNYSPFYKSALNSFVNINVATKIGLGFATIPNLTQTFISSALSLGYGPIFKSAYRAITDKAYRKAIRDYSGAGNLELHQILSGFQPLKTSLTSKIADRITRLSQFQRINRMNKFISASAAYESLKVWQKLATSKPQTARQAQRRDFAIQNMRQMGIKDVNKKITVKNAAEAMYAFSRDSQLQKNIIREPNAFSSPKLQPFLLFKRFGYRQAELIVREANKARKERNFAFLLRLGIAGFAGGTAVNFAKDALEKLITGVDIYDKNYKFKFSDTEDDYTLTDFIDGLGAVGAAGFVSDIIAAESKWRSAEFFLKPVLIADALTMYSALQRIYKDIDEIGFNSITARRSVKYTAPFLGSVGRRFAQRAETPKQRQDYIRTRLGAVKREIFDLMLKEDYAMIERIIRNFNNSFPERPITGDDIGPSEINRYLENKYLRKEKEMESIYPKKMKRRDVFKDSPF